MLKTTADFGQSNLPRAGLLTVIAVVVFLVSIAAADEPPVATDHWSYQAPRRPSLPVVEDQDWPRNQIDYFTLVAMEKVGLQPAAAAGRVDLIRRLTFDLTGLPPALEEVDAFLADQQPGAYRRLVERLLASPRYGERMAVDWLDLARYADTHGYHIDSHRDMWRWRDWVIRAFNQNMPYDQFTVEQLAGDLLPGATTSQQVASGFLRNNMINFEGGAIAEEYRTEYVMDRVMTTGTVWLGQTLECCRCHDHKYDPLTQREFYRLFAFFNQNDEKGLDGKKGNATPVLATPTALQQWQQDRLAVQLKGIKQRMAARRLAGKADQEAWEKRLVQQQQQVAGPPRDWWAYYPLDKAEGQVVIDQGKNKNHGTLNGDRLYLPGKHGQALLFGGTQYVQFKAAPKVDRTSSFSWASWIFPTTLDELVVLEHLSEKTDERGYQWKMENGKVSVRLGNDAKGNGLRIKTRQALPVNTWTHVAVTYDGSSRASGVRVYRDGRLQEVEVIEDQLEESILATGPLVLGSRRSKVSFRGLLDDVMIYERTLSTVEAARLAGHSPIKLVARIQASQRTAGQQKLLEDYYWKHHDDAMQQLVGQQQQVLEQQKELEKSIVTTMVMQERSNPRETFVLTTGDYRSRGDLVTAGTPAVLPAWKAGYPTNRLGLARWLVQPGQPLTARVAVNRLWQSFFAAGLVRTPEDFGTRGQPPTHPELLDWLAVELVSSGWDVKHIVRKLVLSETYRQSSRVGRERYQQDPENRLWSRGPRMRLSAEAVRDNALAVSGLLEEELGGRSFYPPQTAGLWKEISFDPGRFSAQVYFPSEGRDLFRRSLYIFWKRAVPHPPLVAFGAPNRERCTVQRRLTNTPQQALILMNEPTYLAAARSLGSWVTGLQVKSLDDRVDHLFRRIVSRHPTVSERKILKTFYQQQRDRFEIDGDAAEQLMQDVGKQLNTMTLASWTMVAHTILSLDEVITKP